MRVRGKTSKAARRPLAATVGRHLGCRRGSPDDQADCSNEGHATDDRDGQHPVGQLVASGLAALRKELALLGARRGSSARRTGPATTRRGSGSGLGGRSRTCGRRRRRRGRRAPGPRRDTLPRQKQSDRAAKLSLDAAYRAAQTLCDLGRGQPCVLRRSSRRRAEPHPDLAAGRRSGAPPRRCPMAEHVVERSGDG